MRYVFCISLITLLLVAFTCHTLFAQKNTRNIVLDLDKKHIVDSAISCMDGSITIINNTTLITKPEEYPVFNNSVLLLRSKIADSRFQFSVFKKETEFYYSRFSEDADFTKAQFLKGAHFEADTFHRYTYFDGAHFDTGFVAFFSNSVFLDGTDFGALRNYLNRDTIIPVIFKDHVNFQSTNFSGGVSFEKTVFSRDAIFTSAKFNKETAFIDVSFKDVNFRDATFKGSPGFVNTDFHGYSDFFLTHFQQDARFSNSTFYGLTNFSSADFHKEADFTQSKFLNTVNFSSMVVTDTTNLVFFKTRLPDLMDFSNNPRLANVINLTDANFDSTELYAGSHPRLHYINLYKSDLAKIRIDYQHFRLCFYDLQNYDPVIDEYMHNLQDSFILKGKKYARDDSRLYQFLLTTDTIKNYLKQVFPLTSLKDTIVKVFLIDCLYGEFFPKRLPNDEIISIYERVLKNLDIQGLKESYEVLDIEYKDFQNGWFILPAIWNQYGYHKEWIFYWTAGFLFVFTIITFFYLHRFNKEISRNGVYHIENIPGDVNYYSFRNAMKRLWYSFAYCATIFFNFSLKTDQINFKKAGVVFIIIVYSIGLLCIAYMANFVLSK